MCILVDEGDEVQTDGGEREGEEGDEQGMINLYVSNEHNYLIYVFRRRSVPPFGDTFGSR